MAAAWATSGAGGEGEEAVDPGVEGADLAVDLGFQGGELGGLRPHVNVFVNGESIRYLDGLATPVSDGDEVWVVAAVSGG